MSFVSGYERPSVWNAHPYGALPEFLDNRYSNVLLSVRDGYAKLYVERSGRWYLESRGQIVKPGFVLTGFNLNGNTQVRVDAFQVWKFADDLKSPAVDASFPFAKEAAYEIKGIEFPGAFQIALDFGGEKPLLMNFRTVSEMNYTKVTRVKGETIKEKIPLPDAGYEVRVPGYGYHRITVVRTRPNMGGYKDEERDRIAAHWMAFPPASQSPLKVRLKDIGNNVYELWLNEKMLCPVKLEQPLKSVAFHLPGGFVKTLDLPVFQTPVPAGFLVLDPTALQDWSFFRKEAAKPSFVEGIPFLQSATAHFPLSVCAENKGSYYLECDGYLQRSAFDAMPSSVHFSVPTAQYTKAYALCSVDPNARKDMVPVVTARLTNFARPGQGRAQGICHSTVTLPAKPGDPLPPNVKVVGGTKEDPLYLVEFTFDTGSIEDVVFRENNPQMDFEFLGELFWKDNYYVNHAMKPSHRQSSVILHAATLRNTPAELRVDQGRPGATWYLEEKPWMNVHVKPLIPGEYTAKTEIFDVRGKQLTAITEKFTAEKDQKIEFPQKEYGWYGVRTTLSDAKGQQILKRDSAFVLLPPDTRKAGLESPYHAWYINGAHLTPLWPVWSDLAKRQGTRRTTMAIKSEENVKPELFTLGQFPSGASKFKTEEEAEKMIKDWTTKYPHCKAVVIFHESLNGPYPLELVGAKTELTPEQIEKDKKYLEKALFMTKMWRKYAPDVQLVVGNTGSSLGGLARLFRQKIPRELIDKMGEESCGMTVPPEYSTAIADWSLKHLAEIYGYKDLMPTACYEWKCRNTRDLTQIKYAEFLIRDDLIAHAWHHDLMNGGGASCPANSYWNTIWSGGSYTRNPLLDPLPAVAAKSTMTQVLDCAKSTRMIPTGSNTVYVEEFKRGDEYVYAYWTARGNVNGKLTFEKQAEFVRTELFGAQYSEKTAKDGTFETIFSEEPAYVTTKVPLKTASVEMQRTYPAESVPAGKSTVACTLDEAEDWNAVKGVDSRLLVGGDEQKYLFHAADFTIKNVTDEAKGAVMELELAKGETPELVQETGFIRLKKPVELPGKPNTIGIECKGNSSWGKIYFELTDAEGEVWLSAGNGGFGCQTYDWPCSMALNFDGWHNLVFPITKVSSIKVKSPGENEWQWQRSGKSGSDGEIHYPVKLTGIGFTMHRKVLVITEMKDAGTAIRFHNLTTWE